MKIHDIGKHDLVTIDSHGWEIDEDRMVINDLYVWKFKGKVLGAKLLKNKDLELMELGIK